MHVLTNARRGRWITQAGVPVVCGSPDVDALQEQQVLLPVNKLCSHHFPVLTISAQTTSLHPDVQTSQYASTDVPGHSASSLLI